VAGNYSVKQTYRNAGISINLDGPDRKTVTAIPGFLARSLY
jgi:hypothetical protein